LKAFINLNDIWCLLVYFPVKKYYPESKYDIWFIFWKKILPRFKIVDEEVPVRDRNGHRVLVRSAGVLRYLVVEQLAGSLHVAGAEGGLVHFDEGESIQSLNGCTRIGQTVELFASPVLKVTLNLGMYVFCYKN